MNLLWLLVIICFVLWALGFGFRVGGNLIHVLIVLAIVGIICNLLANRGTRI